MAENADEDGNYDLTRRVMSIAEGDQLANGQSQDNRLRFAEALKQG